MFRKFIATPLLAGTLAASMIVNPAIASVISTQQALSADMRASTEADVRASLARDDVRQAMQQLGVDPADADARVASLSDAELKAALAGERDHEDTPTTFPSISARN